MKEGLSNGGTSLGVYFNAKFDDKAGINYAEYFDKLIGLIQAGDIKDLDRIVYYAQYLTCEYCKAANNDARTIIETINENAVSLFEIKWFLNVY